MPPRPEKMEEAELSALLRDSLADDPEEGRRLRRRIEDLLRKNPAALIAVGTYLGIRGWIKVDDLI